MSSASSKATLSLQSLQLQQQQSTPRIRTIPETHNYHLYPFFPEDSKMWMKMVIMILEEEKSTTVSHYPILPVPSLADFFALIWTDLDRALPFSQLQRSSSVR
jgi:hypothetical protein